MSARVGTSPRWAGVLWVLAEHRAELAAMGVTSLAMFGSVARDEARPDSDVDLLVTFDSGRRVGLFEFVGLQRQLEGIFERKVDLGMPDALKSHARDRIFADRIPVLVAGPEGGLAVVPHDEAELSATDARRRAGPPPPPRWTLHAESVLQAAAILGQYTAGLEFDRFCADQLTLSATLCEITRIGEAARGIPTNLRARHPDAPWQDLIDLGSVVIDRYYDLDLPAIWKAAREQVPALVPVVRDILANEATA